MPAPKENKEVKYEEVHEDSKPHSQAVKPARSVHPGVHALKYELQDLETKIAAGTPITSKDLVPLHMVQETLANCKE